MACCHPAHRLRLDRRFLRTASCSPDSSSADDRLEREADAVADRALRTPDPQPSLSAAATQVSRKCVGCEKDGKKLRRVRRGGQERDEHGAHEAGGSGPCERHRHRAPGVGEVLREPGRPLDATTRTFFERRFRRSLTGVRIHDDAKSSSSAAELGARAYTVGSDIVFDTEGYRPHEPAGLSLLAHELVHVIQRANSAHTVRRAPCRSPSQCAVATPGDTGRFTERAAAQQAATARGLGAAPPGSAEATLPGRSGQRATDIEALLSANSVPLQPETLGFFINAAIGASSGAQPYKCRNFPGARPPGRACRRLAHQMVRPSFRRIGGPGRLTASPRTIRGGKDTDSQHHCHRYARNAARSFPIPGVGAIVPTADCDVNTAVFHGPTTGNDFTVGFYLGEISAIASEFHLYYQNAARTPGTAAQAALELEAQQQAFNPGESLRGCIAGLQCACSCATVESLTQQTVDASTGAWPADQKEAFFEGDETQKIPGLWPKALHRK